MDVVNNWKEIKQIFDACISSSKHAAIATVSADGMPHITPIGFVFLRDNRTAYYFEQHSKRMPANFQTNRSVCLLLVNSSLFFWISCLFKGKFSSYPGLRLYGTASETRTATKQELEALKKRIGVAKNLRGSAEIWSGLETVRDITITSVAPVTYPKMMEHLL